MKMINKEKERIRFSRWVLQPQTLVGLSALLLSLCGLFISLYEASLIRQAQRASTWPYVEVGASINQDGVRIWVQNTGVGPARIQAAAVTYRDEVKTDWIDLLNTIAGETADSVDFYKSFLNRRVFPANSSKETIFAMTLDTVSLQNEVIAELQRAILEGMLDVTVCYSSVYDECWTSTLQDVLGRAGSAEVSGDSGEVVDCEAAKRSRI